MQSAHTDGSMDFIKSLCSEFEKHNRIDPAYYEKWDVKRGLRNADGTGVLRVSPRLATCWATTYRTANGFPWRAGSSTGALTWAIWSTAL